MSLTTNTTDILQRFTQKGVFPHEMAFSLLIPLRNFFLSPKKLVERLELQQDMNVLEIGAGPGYFSPHVADALPDGQLTVADIQQEMLDFARKRIEKRKLSNVQYYLCDGESFDLPEAHYDRIFLVSVMGEIEHKAAYLRAFHRMLKPDGVLSISELRGDPDKISYETLGTLLSFFDFRPLKMHGNAKNYTLNFVKV